MSLARFAPVALLLGALAAAAADPVPTALEHPDDAPYWVAGQINVIFQAHPGFGAAYSGEHSLRPEPEAATSAVATFYSTFRLSRWTEGIVDLELAAGGGLSTALGLAGFTNLDVVRNPNLGAEPYLARAMVRQIVPL